MNKTPSRKSRFLSPGWLMFFSAVLCVALVPVVQAAMRYSSEKSERYRELTEMTESERLKIEHSFEEFQKLSPAEQESYRELDRRLNQDDLRLKDTLASYEEFLSTLKPVDRADVERATTTRKRLNVIERIQKERRLRQQRIEAGLMEVEEFRSNFRQAPVFSAAEMEAMTEIIERHLPAEAVKKVNLESYAGNARFAATIAAAIYAWGPKKGGSSRREFSDWELFEPGLREEIVSAIQNEKIRQSLDESDSELWRDRKLRFYAYATIRRAQFDAYPDAAELNKFLDTLDAEKKTELMSQDPWKMYLELGRMYLNKNPKSISKAIDEFPEGHGPFARPPRRGGRGSDDERGREGGRRSRGQSEDFNERGGERGSREGGFRERSGDRTSPETEKNRSGSN